ncbi:methylated DNA protein cysteine S- methyltransferase [Legionella birminghamensis]|uniref:methylated-DNA--[protein]-cysteine S-methyltransferase n=1 Tax=Legionella birminghamensis TaxID=28083 RepID=A0A378ID22_9GAMM|nr:methylated-DNA--[protein]-cysteine S-methyltransferase [Legionella birminghamensis]KTC72564.1 methylated DNA protein cysteine S- methyltransferase [Legionella birminghamensis]STX32836.1 Methylated DNA-protein cysteine methyltransferase [Legionella birminghamensis]
MTDQKQFDYARIEKAIHYIGDHFRSQPSLEEIANAVHVSPFHFQRMFSEWAGISPKKFMQYISLNHAKTLLKNRIALLDVAYETGLSSGGRLHDLFVKIEGMTPGEFKNGGAALSINYCFAGSPFGKLIVASTAKGVCHIAFEEDEQKALSALRAHFPNATYQQMTDKFQQDALSIFQKDWQQLDKIKLHLAGTTFQLKVWESLLKIPMGSLVTYGDIARNIGNSAASRAVGTAIGRNPVAFLIPCHRVIQSSGKLGGYMWGEAKKKAIIGWEAARSEI